MKRIAVAVVLSLYAATEWAVLEYERPNLRYANSWPGTRYALGKAIYRRRTCKAYINQPALRVRPAARRSILGLTAQLRQSESSADTAVQRYFADSADNAAHVRQYAATGSCPDPVLSRLLSCVNVPADIKAKQIPRLLTDALAAFYLTLGDRAPKKADIVQNICTCLEQSWSDYLTDMERESNEAKTFCINLRQYEKHLKQYSQELCEKLLQRSVTLAVMAPK